MRKLLFLVFLFGGGLTASSQSTLGSITGIVHDPSGAAVPNATVILHRGESNTDTTVATNATGEYTAVNVEPGTYTLRSTAPGFALTVADNIHLAARQQLRFD